MVSSAAVVDVRCICHFRCSADLHDRLSHFRSTTQLLGGRFNIWIGRQAKNVTQEPAVKSRNIESTGAIASIHQIAHQVDDDAAVGGRACKAAAPPGNRLGRTSVASDLYCSLFQCRVVKAFETIALNVQPVLEIQSAGQRQSIEERSRVKFD
jgi:hypothetical protein